MTELFRSGWSEDIAAAAVRGNAPLVVGVAASPAAIEAAIDWLKSAVPSTGVLSVDVIPASSVESLGESVTTHRRVVIVPDAWSIDDATAKERWSSWNQHRDSILGSLGRGEQRQTLVLLVTAKQMPIIALAGPDFVAVSEVITMGEGPFAAGPDQTSVIQSHQKARHELEAQYGLTTDEVIRRTETGEELPFAEEVLSRWLAIVQVLREVV